MRDTPLTRRGFIRRGALWVPAIAAGVSIPQILRAAPANGVSNRSVARVGRLNAAGGTCPGEGSPSAESNQTNESYRCGQNSDNRRTGLAAWNDGGVNRLICGLAFESTFIQGNVSGKTYYAEIWTMSGANLGSLQATSAGVTGIAAFGFHFFGFGSPFATGGSSTPYALIFGPETADASNYLWIPVGGGGGGDNILTGYREQFSDTGVGNFGSGSTTDQSIRIYWQ